MKCDKCGYDDHGTGDFSHVCDINSFAMSSPQSPPGQPEGSDLPYRVYEFWSSAQPGKKVLMLAEGREIDEWVKRGDFIRDVTALAARQAPDSGRDAAGGALNDALMRACKELPSGSEIRVFVERDSGWVEWSGRNGEANHIDGEGHLSDDVTEAIDAAIAQENAQ